MSAVQKQKSSGSGGQEYFGTPLINNNGGIKDLFGKMSVIYIRSGRNRRSRRKIPTYESMKIKFGSLLNYAMFTFKYP